jgi:hypothetical protein
MEIGLDFRCGWSVSVVVVIRVALALSGSAPLAMPPLWGFGGDGAFCRRNQKDPQMSASKTSNKTKPSRAKSGAKPPAKRGS